ncbi:Lysophospholipid acyltransferase LPEAT2 [Linum grandiflorum]
MAAAADDLSSPLLPSPPPHILISVDGDNKPTSTNHHQPFFLPQSNNNPFDFLGIDQLGSSFSVPPPSTVDPFRNGTPRIDGIYEVLKLLLLLPIILIRLLLFGLCLAVGFLATKLAIHGWKDKENPMPRWRSRLMWITRFSARGILFSFGYQWIRRKGKPAPREIAPIVVSNHVSYIEPIFYFYEMCPTIVASESHDALPFVGTIIRAMQVIYVNRFSQPSRKNAVNEIKRKGACDRFPRVLLFPEGTTSNGRGLLSFQLGAFLPNYAIQPVVVRYPHVHFDQSWGNVSLGLLMFRMFSQFHNYLEVEYLPIVSPLDNCKENPAHFSKRTSNAMATALNVLQTFHSYGDVMLLMRAAESGQENPSSFMVEMAKVESLFHIRSLEAMDFLEKFLSMNPDSTGRVKFYDFLRAHRLRPCTLSEQVFAFLDVEKSGSITFKQFLYGSLHVMKQPQFRQTCELAFSECDVRGDHEISEDEVTFTVLHLHLYHSDEYVHELFKLFDADAKGTVSKDNFSSFLRRNPLFIALFSVCLARRDTTEDSDSLVEFV